MLDQLIDVAHAERPMRHADRQAVDGDLGHEAFRHHLEFDRVVLEPLRARQLFDARDVGLPVFTLHGCGHRREPRRQEPCEA
jgi:hypothetical protein